MTWVFVTLGLLGLLFLFPYVIYPVLVRLFEPTRLALAPASTATDPALPGDGALPCVAVLIPAHNEARTLRGKLNNSLNLDYPSDRLKILVCSDGSTDGTDAIVEGFAHRGVTLLRNEVRSGKATAVERLFSASDTDLVLFTDASARLQPDCLKRLVAALDAPSVAVAVARYEVRPGNPEDDESPNPQAEAAYWGFEARLRKAEAERDMLLGASGAGYLIRREVVTLPPKDTINDDFVIPLTARLSGHRVAYVHDAVVSETPTESTTTQYRRWVRIAYGNWQMMARYAAAFSLARPRVALPFLRKLTRTLGPWFLLAGVVTLGVAAALSDDWVWPAVTAAGGAALAATAIFLDGTTPGAFRPVQLVRFAALAQIAYLHGALRFIFGQGKGIWKRAAENEVLALDRPAPIPTHVRVAKRLVDILGATVALIVFAPVMLIVGLWIKLDSPGNVFYVQERERPGEGGRPRPFRMFKFRSMVMNAEAKTGPVWAASSPNAGRVTKVGQFIRKYRLDELPQFINVLIGDMSIVGPRPERPFFTRMLEEQVPGYSDRIAQLKPGITGWAQVHVASDTSVDSVKEKVMHDLVYLAHCYGLGSYLKMELYVLWRTVFVMLSGKGAA
jgi:lipopolysaccharide/colanic/teichoic acid biosynthesis glycosyltransferase/GT2 family glycosyltransferase